MDLLTEPDLADEDMNRILRFKPTTEWKVDDQLTVCPLRTFRDYADKFCKRDSLLSLMIDVVKKTPDDNFLEQDYTIFATYSEYLNMNIQGQA